MDGRFRALLIGVPSYRDPDIDNLLFIEEDLAELSATLTRTGYEVTVHNVAHTDFASIDTAIEFFIGDAESADTLLIFLSGHGIHHANMDYLVPSGAMMRSSPFYTRCVPIDVGRYVEASHAGNVVLMVDACREGIHFNEKSGPSTLAWSDREVTRTASRHFAYVYACSPGEKARFATVGNSSFSFFSRAVSTVADDDAGPATLADIELAVQAEIDTLTSAHGYPRQQVRILTETGKDFILLPRPRRRRTGAAGEHSWVTAARTHTAWNLADGRPGQELLREATTTLVAYLARCWERDNRLVQSDPWHAPGWAERMNGKVRWLLSTLNPEKLSLSPAEAALLTAVPFLHTAYWTRLAASAYPQVNPADLTIRGTSDDRAAFERFTAGYGRLLRRAQRIDLPDGQRPAAGIGWWLFHRWLIRRPASYQLDLLVDLLLPSTPLPEDGDSRLVPEVFAVDRLLELLRTLRTDTASLAQGDRDTAPRPIRPVANSSEMEQSIREQLVAFLLSAAERFTLDPVGMSEVVVDHLGISGGVSLPQLHETLAEAAWEARGRTRVLAARCHHPAVDLALREQASAVDSLLRHIDTAAADGGLLAPLADLPTRATADRVVAATGADGQRAYDSTGFRFRLADDRIQELLMGEQLYGDPALAVRELYQNALDACRYRQARIEYLEVAGRHPTPWIGSIRFTQGVMDGRPFLDCIDNGVGMGLRELVEVFSHAGMRFADLPEYVEERATWKQEGIELYPNSRFGIGVLSYFMLADEITVTTCRLDRSGRPGTVFEVHIAGPGALFRVHDRGPGEEAGTTVRLHLRPTDTPLSCVDLLRRILWISEFAVEAIDATGRQSWAAGQLSSVAPIGAEDPLADDARRTACRIDATSAPTVWWCDTNGGVVADGVWVGTDLFGAVVNLTGPCYPRLTVDRRRILAHDDAEVTRLQYREIPVLLAEDATVLTFDWLCALAGHHPDLADEICTQAAAHHRRWKVAGDTADIAVVGCFPADGMLFRRRDGSPLRAVQPVLPEVILRWRLHAWIEAGLVNGLTVAAPAGERLLSLPTDDVVLAARAVVETETSNLADFRVIPAPRLGSDRPVPVGHLAAAAVRTGRSVGQVAARLAALGFAVPDLATLPDQLDRDDRTLLSRGLDGEEPWLGSDRPVPVGHLAAAAVRTGRSVGQVAARLAALGFAVPDLATLPDQLDRDDRTLLSRGLDGEEPWLGSDRPVPVGHLAAAAVRTGRSVGQVAARLAALGFAVPDPATLPDQLDRDDRTLLSRGLNSWMPWLDSDRPVPVGHLARAAARTSHSPRQVAARLAAFGFAVPDPATLPDQLDRGDRTLLSRGLDGEEPWLGSDRPVPVGHLAAAAVRTGRSVGQVAARLAALGFAVPDLATLPDQLDRDDRTLLSCNLDGEWPWLDDLDGRSLWLDSDRPVPAVHLARAAAKTGRSPFQVAARLAALGFAVPDPATLPDQLDRDDLILLSRGLDGRSPWLDSDRPVPAVHLARAAAKTGRSPFQVAARLAALGLTVPDPATLPDQLDRDDLHLLGDERYGWTSWLGSDRPVPVGHLAAAAVRTGRSVGQVAARLAALGFTVADPATLPDQLDRGDLILLSRGLDGRSPWLGSDRPVPVGHLAAAAVSTGRSVDQVATRLAALGFAVADLATVPDQLDRDDLILLSGGLDGRSPWLDSDRPVSAGYLAVAAVRTGRSPRQVASWLAALGFAVADPATLPDQFDRGDLILLSDDRHGRWQSLGSDRPIPTVHLAEAAVRTGRSPRQVASRLVALGFTVPDPATLPDQLDRDDRILLSRDLDGEEPWLDSDRPVPVGHLAVTAVRTGRSVGQVAARLAAFGLTVADRVPDQLDPDDAILLSRDLDSRWPWLDPDRPIPPAHLAVTAVRTGRSVGQVAARLAALGFTVADLATVPDQLDRGDLILLSRGLDGRSPWLDSDRPVQAVHLAEAAVRTGRSPRQVASRLAAFGFAVPDPATLPDQLDRDDRTLLSRNLDGEEPWLHPGQLVPAGHLIAAFASGRKITEVASRLTKYGFRLPASINMDNLVSDGS
ncbi:peptidase C14 caspase catalytic subunit p20 [Parafrankia sp. EAN1pec]|uniref:wHTH domain-containing protein n=1 Tax=Parafrankia sp. (strain EAN1pec) TaxID=298653 RepID=UPI00005431FF|nr:peptidase C14 caspase catalytic subunit p20 [Frankia sp. EAN1pec]